MKIIKQTKNLKIFAGDGMARGLFMAENIKTGRVSLWDNCPRFNLSDCKY